MVLRSALTSPRRLLILALTAAALLCGTVPAAHAYVVDGERWPGTTITYYPTIYRTAVAHAAKNWNNAHVGVRLVRVSSSSAADVIVKGGAQGCGGFSIVGYSRWQSWVQLAPGCPRDLMSLVATHEFGHTLGLGHEQQKCARMNAVVDYGGTPEFCQPRPMSYWLQHTLKRDDINGARSLYQSQFRSSSVRRARVSAGRVAGYPAWAGTDLPLLGDNELAAALTG